jgi:AcrR family transcriptional regulator
MDPKSSYHHGNLAQALLERAEQVLAASGPEKLSLRALAEHVGVSPSAVYRHFKDKDEILSALAAEGFAEMRDSFRAFSDLSPEDRLGKIGEAYVSFALKNPGKFQLMFSSILCVATPGSALNTNAVEAYGELLAVVAQVLPKPYNFAQGNRAATAAWSLVHGLAMLQVSGAINDEPGPGTLDPAKLGEILRFGLGRA